MSTRTRFISNLVAGMATAAVLCLLLVSRPAAQNPASGNAKAADVPTPRLSNGHPNLTGFYSSNPPPVDLIKVGQTTEAGGHELTRTNDGSLFFDYAGANGGSEAAEDGYAAEKPVITAPYKPEYLVKVKQIVAVQYGRTNIYDPNLDCKPEGVPRTSLGVMYIVQNPKALALLYEEAPGPYYRLIYTDGRKHPDDLDTSYLGHSIGDWQGDTLVVDTVGLTDDTWLAGAAASIHSDQEHVIERWDRQGNTISYQATVEDPVVFTKPWVLPTRRESIGPAKDYIQPEMCNTNDKIHFVTNDTYKCNWCASDTLYGGSSDKLTIPDDARKKSGGRGGE